MKIITFANVEIVGTSLITLALPKTKLLISILGQVNMIHGCRKKKREIRFGEDV